MGEVIRCAKVNHTTSHSCLCCFFSTSLQNSLTCSYRVFLRLFVFRIDFYFVQENTTHQQRNLVYRTALLFSSAPPSAPLHVDEYVEEWVDRCNVGIEGTGGPLTMEEEEEYHMNERKMKAEERQEGETAGQGAEGAEGGNEGEGESEGEGEEGYEEYDEVAEEPETERKPFMLVFPHRQACDRLHRLSGYGWSVQHMAAAG